jgi:hypothetical protein
MRLRFDFVTWRHRLLEYLPSISKSKHRQELGMTLPVLLKDSYGRAIRDLRISITDRCNFRCFYCMPEEAMEWKPKPER